ncbi:F-box domain-containing protein [Colletotrichum musicola]|uniref:F-box domain-containing protein n=1 Tax=Colletotrichum musicola TaxID=2175873 RepID=A0A8H6KJF7_9PEZI|nr:F-box domain-containing protein [Colletotrichum musicola]
MSAERSQHAMDIVLAIPELLESILVHVDMKTLLVSAPRVCKAWKATMDESPAVQQTLFFKPVGIAVSPGPIHSPPESDDEVKAGEQERTKAVIINPLLAAKFNKCFFDFGPTYSFHRRANSFYEMPWTPRPIKTERESWGGYSQLRPAPLSPDEARVEKESRDRFTRRGASWRRMLVSQPPPPSLGYVRCDISDLPAEGQRVQSANIPAGSGLRMGQLYDVVQHHVGHHGRHSLWFRVMWGRPISPFAVTRVRDEFERHMAATNVVVEFMHADDTSLPNHPQDPADVGVFDAAFRCEEYEEVKVGAEEILAYPSEFPMFDGRYVIWHWRLLPRERATPTL